MSVNIKLLEQEDDYLGRNIQLDVDNKIIDGFQISRRSNRTKYDRIVFQKSNKETITEYSINIDHKKLDELSSDNEKYKQFIWEHLPRLKSSTDINMIIFQIDEEKGTLTDTDLETMADLLLTRGNDIIVPPFIRTNAEKFDTERYLHIISILRDCLGQGCNLACSIPQQASKKDIPRIMDSMDTSCQIFIKDFNGKKVFDSVNEMQMRTILRKIRNIEKEYSEGSFVYAFDSRLNPKNGDNKNFAEGQISSAVGLNAVGPKRKRDKMSKAFLEKLGDTNPYDGQKLFNSEDYHLYSIASGHITERYSDFVQDNYNIDYREMGIKDLSNSIFAFNHYERITDIHNIDTAISDNELKQYITSKNTPDPTLKFLEKVSKKVNSSE